MELGAGRRAVEVGNIHCTQESSSSFQFLHWKQFHFIRDTFPSHRPTSPPPRPAFDDDF